MSLRTRINGFTAWVNLRLGPYDSLLANVLMDLIKGNHIQQLLHSLTGKTLKKIQSMDGLTLQQKTTRIEWMVAELKKSEILPEDSVINGRMVSQKSADHLFDFLWRLVCHDIWFTWERMEFLQLNDDHLLSEVQFQWTPEPPPKKKRKRVMRNTASMMSGFGASSVVEGPSPSPEPLPDGFEQFPGADKMKQYKPHMPKGGWYSYPAPDECILEMINAQLQRVSEGRKLIVYSLDDLVDSRVLCGLVNSFVPGTFTTEVMLNDRWIINLAFRTIEKMLHASNPMGSQDLSEADPKAICAYMCFFFMSSFNLKQSKAVVNRLKELKLLIKESERDLIRFPQKLDTLQALKDKKALEENLDDFKREQEILSDTYDIPYITSWLENLDVIQQDTRNIIADKMTDRFDLVPVPRNMTINELCLSIACNLQLTQGNGFYRGFEKETCLPDRRIVLRKKDTAEFMDDFTGAPGSKNIREFLGMSRHEIVVVEPARFPDYEFYFESKSRNKILKSGSV